MMAVMQNTCLDSEFLDSANVELKRTPVNLVLALRQVMETYQKGERLVAKSFSFQCAHPALWVEIDNNKLLQVVKLFRKSTKGVCVVMQSVAKHLARIVERPWRCEQDASLRSA